MIDWKALLDPTEEPSDAVALEGERALTIDGLVAILMVVALLLTTYLIVANDDGHGAGLFGLLAVVLVWAGLLAGWIWPPLYGCATGLAAAAVGLVVLTGFGSYLVQANGVDPSVAGGVSFLLSLGGLIVVVIGGFALLGALSFARGEPRGARTLVRASALLFLATVLAPLALHAVAPVSAAASLWQEYESCFAGIGVAFLLLCLAPWWLVRNGLLARTVSHSVGPVTVVPLPEPFRVVSRDFDRYAIELVGAPENCVTLDPSPPAREEILGAGRWIVLCVSLWNGPDREAVGRLFEVATHLALETFAGVRPFKHPREFATWVPEIARETRSPIWLVYDRGALIDHWTGPCSADEILRRLPEEHTGSDTNRGSG